MARNGIRFREFKRRRTEEDNVTVPEGRPQRTVTEVTDHLALARDMPGRQIVYMDTTVQVSPQVKTVLVTGASKGVGLLKELCPWRLIPMDVAEQQSIEEAAMMLRGVPIDLLINNAGASGLFNLNDTTAEDCVRQFQVNAMGPLFVTRALLSNLQLAVSARGCAFVAQVTSRIGSVSDNSSGGAYAHRASKGALNVFTKSLAIDLEPHKIGCLLLHPGNVNTSYNNFNGAVEPEESVDGMARLIARAKLGDPLQLRHFGKGDVIDW
ncbi:Short chain dehydrogenase [Phytophthora megakarya]|uniref:Short chain dehydrogenase n=1 Tax=Phytophthora megakarya TaxID=4795 RepID=A0A225UIJ9_9STRA|nr:Short chain dehydrogenase [Phytophthora megakarya]